MAESISISIVKIHPALDRMVDFNECVNAFLQPAEHVRRVAASKVAYSLVASRHMINAQLHRMLCTTVVWRDSYSSWRLEELVLCGQWPPLDGWSQDGVLARHTIATTHTAADVVQVYFLTVRRTSLLVSDRYWITKEEMADFTESILPNFGWIVRHLEKLHLSIKLFLHHCLIWSKRI